MREEFLVDLRVNSGAIVVIVVIAGSYVELRIYNRACNMRLLEDLLQRGLYMIQTSTHRSVSAHNELAIIRTTYRRRALIITRYTVYWIKLAIRVLRCIISHWI